MKRLLILIISCLCFTQAFSDDHLKFLGFPIDGTVDEYASKIKSKGFYVSPDNVYASKGLRLMKGPFLGKERDIRLNYDQYTNLMYGVTFSEKFYDKEEAKSLYDKLVSLLREKYPNATFDPYPSVETDGVPIYCCSFEIKEGIICVGIFFDEDPGYGFRMSYSDRINSNKKNEREHQEALDDL